MLARGDTLEPHWLSGHSATCPGAGWRTGAQAQQQHCGLRTDTSACFAQWPSGPRRDESKERGRGCRKKPPVLEEASASSFHCFHLTWLQRSLVAEFPHQTSAVDWKELYLNCCSNGILPLQRCMREGLLQGCLSGRLPPGLPRSDTARSRS